jgi:hypothetical protein
MALDATEQELYDFAMSAMPEWFRELERTKEDLSAMAKIFGAAKRVGAYWLDMAMIGNATGPTAKVAGNDTNWAKPIPSGALGPDWLEMHAEDRGTRRMDGETDPTMRQRLRLPPDALARAVLLAASQAMVTAAGVSGTVAMVELPRDAAHLGTRVQDHGTGGSFAKSGSLMAFVPSIPFAFPPYVQGISGAVKRVDIVFSGCAEAGNNGTFEVSGLEAQNDMPVMDTPRSTRA